MLIHLKNYPKPLAKFLNKFQSQLQNHDPRLNCNLDCNYRTTISRSKRTSTKLHNYFRLSSSFEVSSPTAMKISLSKSVPEDFGAEVVALSSPVCFALDAEIGQRLCGHFPTETATGTRMAWHRNGDGDRDELTAFEQLPRDMLAKRLPAISVRPIADISTKQIHLYPCRRFFSGGDAGKSPPFADTG